MSSYVQFTELVREEMESHTEGSLVATSRLQLL